MMGCTLQRKRRTFQKNKRDKVKYFLQLLVSCPRLVEKEQMDMCRTFFRVRKVLNERRFWMTVNLKLNEGNIGAADITHNFSNYK
jgi:hypothetical protein